MSRKIIVKPKLTDAGFPVHSRFYQQAHRKADVAEKARFPKGYERMKKVDKNLPARQLAGKNSKSGMIFVSAKVPKSLRKEVAYHESVESKAIKKARSKKR
jgi:hypothetical protein